MKFLLNKCRTLFALFRFFLSTNRIIFIPMIVMLLLVSILLVFANGLSVVAPFVYTLF